MMTRNQNQGHNWKGGKMVRHYLDEVCSLWPYEEKKKVGNTIIYSMIMK